jgi:hypothetical protein
LHGTIIAAGTSQQCVASFTAPVAGWVVAMGHTNVSSPNPAGIAYNLSINGNNVSGDNTLLSQCHIGSIYVGAGTAVTCVYSGTNSTGSNSNALSMYCDCFFIPAVL